MNWIAPYLSEAKGHTNVTWSIILAFLDRYIQTHCFRAVQEFRESCGDNFAYCISHLSICNFPQEHIIMYVHVFFRHCVCGFLWCKGVRRWGYV